MSEWQPIETAPKDGTEVLYWSADCGFLAGNEPPGYARGVWTKHRGKWSGAIDMKATAATRWQPLPPQPSE